MKWLGSEDCDCPDCRPRGPRPFTLASTADLVRTLGAKEARSWLARLSGRQPPSAPGKVEEEIDRWLAEPGTAPRTLAKLSPPCRLAVALLVEAPVGLTSAELDFELGELAGSAVAGRAREDLLRAGLAFATVRGRANPDVVRLDPSSWLVLPAPMRDWLAPAALPLLLASASPPPEDARASGADGADPGLATVIWLAALRSVGARTTGSRLYKKDRERAEALAGGGDADAIVRALAAGRLVFADRAPGSLVVSRWAAIERWARLPAAARAADDLYRRHRAELPWQTLVGARGAWVEEVHLARRSRLVTSTVYARPIPDPLRRREAWGRQRVEIEAWPEVERSERDGRTFFRLRPELARALDPDAPARSPARIFVQPDLEVILPRDAGLGAALLLARVARLVRADVVVTFKLTPESVRQAVLEGTPASKIVADLDAASVHGVPPAVERAVFDWAGNVGRCTVAEAMVVRFDDETLAGRAALALGGAAERVGPTTLIIADDRAHEADSLLEKAGFPPRATRDDADSFDDVDDPFADDDHVDDDDDRQDGIAARSIGDGVPDADREENDRVALALGLNPTRARVEAPDPGAVDEVRAARAGVLSSSAAERFATTAGGGAPPAGWLARAANGADAVLKTLRRAAQADADIAVALRDGSHEVVRLRGAGARSVSPGDVLRAYVYSTGAERQWPADAVVSALALYGTSRNVARNHSCPCGSGHKFKRCCGRSQVEPSVDWAGSGRAAMAPEP